MSSIFSFSSQFKGKNYYIDQYKKHVKESIGITIIISAIFLYMYSIAKDVLRGKRKRLYSIHNIYSHIIQYFHV